MKTPIILTVILTIVYSIIGMIFGPMQTLALGQNAGNQFVPSDVAYVQFSIVNSLLTGTGAIITTVYVLGLLVIWGTVFSRIVIKEISEIFN